MFYKLLQSRALKLHYLPPDLYMKFLSEMPAPASFPRNPRYLCEIAAFDGQNGDIAVGTGIF